MTLAEPITEPPPLPIRARRWRSTVAATITVVALAVLTWVAHFGRWRELGFFSDDESFATLVMGWTPADARRMAAVLTFSYPDPQGRPLGFLLGLELPFWGYHAAGVLGMYVVAWVVLATNVALLYALLARRLPRPLPVVGALMFILFPADTTRPFLCHAHILQPSLTFALAAAHLFLCRRWWAWLVGYGVATLCLVTYETALLPLVAVPLLDGPRPSLKRLAINAAILAALIGVVGVTRTMGGEVRAAEATGGKLKLMWHAAAGCAIGPAVVLRACWHWPRLELVEAARYPTHALAIAVACCAVAPLVWLAGRGAIVSVGAVRRAALFGGVAIAASYGLSFTHYPPTFEQGQSPSVHTAAAIGTAALAAAAAGAAWRRWPRASLAVASVYFGLLVTSAVGEQGRYAACWHARQAYWRQVLALCPDLADGTVVISDGTMPPVAWVMPINLWSDAMVPAQVYQFPAGFRLVPIVSSYPHGPGVDWRSNVRWDPAGRLGWRSTPCMATPGQVLAQGNTILLRSDQPGHFERVTGVVDIAGRPFRLKPVPAAGTVAAFPHLPFYGVLIDR